MSAAAIEVDGLRFAFAGREQPTLADVGFSLPAGSVAVVAGRTGSGKSTLLRALAGLIPHQTSGQMQGSVRLLGDDTRRLAARDLAARVGLVLQSADDQICTTTVSSELAFGLENLCLEPDEIAQRIERALDVAGLAELADRPTHQLSGGQKQHLVLAGILAMQPRVLLLDEPLAQLDPEAAADLLSLLERLRADGLTIVLAEHRLDDVLPLADTVLVLEQGRLLGHVAATDLAASGDALKQAGLKLPEVSRLALRLGWEPAASVEELTQRYKARVSGDGRTRESMPKPAAEPDAPQPDPALLWADGLSYHYPGADSPALQSVSFPLRPGERVAVVGPNGSGKSTLLALAAGLLRPAAGRIECLGRPPGVPNCGLVLQNPDLMLFSTSVREELAFGPRQLGLAEEEVARRVQEAAGALSLDALSGEPPQALSQGQRLRAAVAATLSLQPRVLLLDEPTTGQDQPQVEAVMSHLAGRWLQGRAGRCLMFSTHDLRTAARWSDRVLVLVAGRLVADCPTRELLDDDELLARARLRRPPLLELRHRLGLSGLTVDELAEEVRA